MAKDQDKVECVAGGVFTILFILVLGFVCYNAGKEHRSPSHQQVKAQK